MNIDHWLTKYLIKTLFEINYYNNSYSFGKIKTINLIYNPTRAPYSVIFVEFEGGNVTFTCSKNYIKTLILIKLFIRRWKNKHMTLKKCCRDLIIKNNIVYSTVNIPIDLKIYIKNKELLNLPKKKVIEFILPYRISFNNFL